MTPLHKKYETYKLIANGTVAELDDVLPIVRKHWPDAYMEGSAGLARMYLERKTRKFVAYTWGVGRPGNVKWKYLVFSNMHEW